MSGKFQLAAGFVLGVLIFGGLDVSVRQSHPHPRCPDGDTSVDTPDLSGTQQTPQPPPSPSETSKSTQEHPTSSSFKLLLSSRAGAQVTFPPGLLISVDSILWISSGYGTRGCFTGMHFGDKEHVRRCGTVRSRACQGEEQVSPEELDKLAATWKKGGTVTMNHNGQVCRSYFQRAVIEVTISEEPPPLYADRNCSFNAHNAYYSVSNKGLEAYCECRSNYEGRFCDKCAPGYEGFPRCIPEEPFIPDIVPRQHQGEGDICPEGLYDIECDFDKYPQALRNMEISPQYLSVLACHVGSLLYGCEFGPRTTKVESLVTIVTANYGAQFMLLFESVRVFAPDVPFVVGYSEKDEVLGNKLKNLIGKGNKLEVFPISQTQVSWFNEKPLLLKRALEKYTNALWIDVDAFLVAPLGEMPDSPGATFGCSVHTHQGWGSGSMPHQFGFVNTGILWAKRGTRHLDAWLKATNRFDQKIHGAKAFKGTPMPYLDQGPMDWSLTSTKGGFKLDPVWNVAWWVDEGKVQKRKDNWFSGAAVSRFEDDNLKLSPDGSCIHLHGRCTQVVHSHFSAFERNYGTVDRGFNTHIRDIIVSAKEGTLLHKFKPRFLRYASHMDQHAIDKSTVPANLIKGDFSSSLKDDW